MLHVLRGRVWVREKLWPTEWQISLLWAALIGAGGALSSLAFRGLAEGVHELLTHSNAGVVETMRQLPRWAVLSVPAAGGLAAGIVLRFGRRLAPVPSSTDYMEAIAIGSGRVPIRASLVKSGAALFSIGSGGSIGREGPMVQLATVVASLAGRLRRASPPQLRLLVACGAAAGVAAAYNAPIAGSLFVAEIILGTISIETLGPLIVSAMIATLLLHWLTNAGQLYQVPVFRLNSPKELLSYVVLGLLVGVVGPWFLRSLRAAERIFVATRLSQTMRLTLGGLAVGGLALLAPEVCGNGYSVVVDILNGHLVWTFVLLIFAAKWLATAASVGSGAPGGVFTPSLFIGASAGLLFGTAVHSVWPAGAADPRAFALVGMGALLAAVTHAPVMAIAMLFEMTLSYDIIPPLMLASVIAFYTAKGLEPQSLYSESLQKKRAAAPPSGATDDRVAALMKLDPPFVALDAGFGEISRLLLSLRVNNLYVVDDQQRFLGAISLHDIKPFLAEPGLAGIVIAGDILREDFPRIAPDASLDEALGCFLRIQAERLPVVAPDGRLLGSVAKNDLLLTVGEQLRRREGAQPESARRDPSF